MSAWPCPGCDGQNPAGTRFCGHCGDPRPDQPAAQDLARSASGGTVDDPQPSDVPPSPSPDTSGLTGFVPRPIAERLAASGGRLEDERRLITALFADVSGFTALSQRLDPEALHDLIAPILEMLAEVVDTHGGYVDKFAGDAVLAMFGTPITHEDDAERAVAAALAMHQRLPEVLAGLGEDARDLTLHIGVNTGHVVARAVGDDRRRDYTVLGQAVNLAQRLESVAARGETLAGSLTRQLTVHRFAYELAGRFELKGFPEPVVGWRLLGDAEVDRHRRPLLGRDRERAALREAFAASRTGTATLMTVEGEPGVGKSHLVDDLLVDARARGAAVLEGTATAYGLDEAYGPLRGLIASMPEATGAADLPDALDALGLADEVRYLHPLLTGIDIDVEPEAFRRGLHTALTAVLQVLASSRPVVLVVQDLHDVDPDSHELLAQLVRVPVPSVLTVVTARPEGRAGLADLRAATPAQVRKLELGPLSADGIATLLEHELEGPVAPSLTAQVAARSDGNPLFITQLAATLREGGHLDVDDGGWQLTDPGAIEEVPASIEGLLGGRIDRLPIASVELLQVAAVVGRSVDVSLLAEVAEVTEVGPQLTPLFTAGLADPDPASDGGLVRLRHELVRDVAYHRLVRRRARALHLRTADVLEERGGESLGDLEEVARHLIGAGVGSRAVDALERAAEAAVAVFANTTAIEHLERAEAVIEEHGERQQRRGAIAMELGRLRELIGDYDGATRAYEVARDLTGAVAAWRGIASSRRRVGDHASARAALEAAFGATDDVDELRELWLERAWAVGSGGDLTASEEAARQGLELRSDAVDRIQAELWLNLAIVHERAERSHQAEQAATAARAILDHLDEPAVTARAARVLGATLARLGRLQEAESVLREGRRTAERIGSVEEIAGLLINLALLRYEARDLEEAATLTRGALAEFERIGHRSGTIVASNNLATMLAELERPDESIEVGQRALALAEASDDHFHAGDALDALARAHLLRGDLEEAADAADRAAERFELAGASERAAAPRELAATIRRTAADQRDA